MPRVAPARQGQHNGGGHGKRESAAPEVVDDHPPPCDPAELSQCRHRIGRIQVVEEEGRVRDVDGIVCGHIHKAELRLIKGTLYANCGDWVESCTALVEHEDGRLEIIRWPELPGQAASAIPGDGLASGLPILSDARSL